MIEQMTLDQYIAIIEFLNETMTEEQATDLMDRAKRDLAVVEIVHLLAIAPVGPFYTQLSMFNAEMGGLSRY